MPDLEEYQRRFHNVHINGGQENDLIVARAVVIQKDFVSFSYLYEFQSSLMDEASWTLKVIFADGF